MNLFEDVLLMKLDKGQFSYRPPSKIDMMIYDDGEILPEYYNSKYLTKKIKKMLRDNFPDESGFEIATPEFFKSRNDVKDHTDGNGMAFLYVRKASGVLKVRGEEPQRVESGDCFVFDDATLHSWTPDNKEEVSEMMVVNFSEPAIEVTA